MVKIVSRPSIAKRTRLVLVENLFLNAFKGCLDSQAFVAFKISTKRGALVNSPGHFGVALGLYS